MSFIKVEAVKAYQNGNHEWKYDLTTPVIINSSHIIDIHRLTFNIHPFSSEAEKEFERGNDAGRFEQEVRELASVIDDLDSGALILLNETFQTTAYDEGADGLYHILNYFTDRKIRFLLVSHLHQLEGRFSGGDVGVYRTQPGFKVCADQT